MTDLVFKEKLSEFVDLSLSFLSPKSPSISESQDIIIKYLAVYLTFPHEHFLAAAKTTYQCLGGPVPCELNTPIQFYLLMVYLARTQMEVLIQSNTHFHWLSSEDIQAVHKLDKVITENFSSFQLLHRHLYRESYKVHPILSELEKRCVALPWFLSLKETIALPANCEVN